MTEDVIKGVAAEVARAIQRDVEALVEAQLRAAVGRAFGLGIGVGLRRTADLMAQSNAIARSEREARALIESRAAIEAEKARTGTTKRALTLDAVTGVLKSGPADGLRNEQIRAALGLPQSATRRLNRLLRKAVSAKTIVRTGDRRATKYRLRASSK